MTPTSTTPGPEDLALSSGNSAVMAWKFGPARLEIQARGTEIWALGVEISDPCHARGRALGTPGGPSPRSTANFHADRAHVPAKRSRGVGVMLARAAVISRDGVYRYSLTRRWCDTAPLLRWIMLNPSRADATSDDPTIRRCLGFARGWGYGGIVVHNLFGLRATNPAELKTHPDPVGRDNDRWLLGAAESRLATVCAWGAHGQLHNRAGIVLGLLRDRGVTPMCLGRTQAGQPRHPLYIPANTFLKSLTSLDTEYWRTPMNSQPARAAHGPVWAPAEQHIPHLLSDLMYMSQLDHGGITIHQYKHVDTRRYINLDDTGQAWEVDFVDCDSGEVSAHRITLAQALQLLEG